MDIYPYVIAGRYVTKQIGSDRQKIYLWTRKPQDPGDIRAVSDSLSKNSTEITTWYLENALPRQSANRFLWASSHAG